MDFGAGFRKLTLGSVAVASLVTGGGAAAQQVTGTLGRADATTTITGKQIPPPPPKFGGVIKETAKDSTPWWPKTLVMASAAIEAATGVALIAAPNLVARVLLGEELFDSGVAVARVAGCGLLALGLACWPGGDDATPHDTRALFVYNLMVGLYLGYLRVGAGFTGLLLWPACALHVVFGVLFVTGALGSNRSFQK